MAGIEQLLDRRVRTGREERDGRKWVTAIRWISKAGEIVTADGTVWLARSVPQQPQMWRDQSQIRTDARPLASALNEIGKTSRTIAIPGLRHAQYRRVGLLVHSWNADLEPSDGVSAELAQWQRGLYEIDGLPAQAKRRSVLLLVMLIPSALKGVVEQMRELTNQKARQVLGASDQVLQLYRSDSARMQAILAAHGMRIPTRDQYHRIDAWYTDGGPPDPLIIEYPDHLSVGTNSTDAIEMLALQHIDTEFMNSSTGRWIGDLVNDPYAPHVLSAFGTLEPANETRRRARKAARRTRGQAQTSSEIGEEGRSEHETGYAAAKDLESYLTSRPEPWVSQCSVIVGRRRVQDATTFVEQARQDHGIEFLSLTNSQHLALAEASLGPRHANPYVQDLSISHLANTGIIGYEHLGDPTGIHLGYSDESNPVRYDTGLSGRMSKPPICPIFAATGSGKTFEMQMAAVQCGKDGQFTPFFNPKVGSDLSPMAALVPGGRYHNLTEFMDAGNGALDPFTFAPPAIAARILADFLLTFFHDLFGGFAHSDEMWRLRDILRTGLQTAAAGGVRCSLDAIKAVDWPDAGDNLYNDIRYERIMKNLETNPLFALAIGDDPSRATQSRHLGDTLTLIQYGSYQVPLPSPAMTPNEYADDHWFGVAVTQLVMTYCLEQIYLRCSGNMFIDEATVLTASQIGRDTLDTFGRRMREQGASLMIATQRPSDLVNSEIDIEEFHGRCITGHLRSDSEKLAAARFMGLNTDNPADNARRSDFFDDCGVKEPTGDTPGRPPWFLHEDLHGNVGEFMALVPEHIRKTFSTRADEKLERRRAAEAAEQLNGAVVAAARDDDIDPSTLLRPPIGANPQCFPP